MVFESKYQLEINSTWFVDIDPKYMIKESLTSPFVINYINDSDLTLEWKDFTHAVHLDIYQNFDRYYNLVKMRYTFNPPMRILFLWCYILEEMGLFIYLLPDTLLDLYYNHL